MARDVIQLPLSKDEFMFLMTASNFAAAMLKPGVLEADKKEAAEHVIEDMQALTGDGWNVLSQRMIALGDSVFGREDL